MADNPEETTEETVQEEPEPEVNVTENKVLRALRNLLTHEEVSDEEDAPTPTSDECTCQKPKANVHGELTKNITMTSMVDQLETAVKDTLKQKEAQTVAIEDVLLDENAVVVMADQNGGTMEDDPFRLFQINFEVDDEQVSLTGDPVEVTRSISYKPVEGEPATNQEFDMSDVNTVDELIEQAPEGIKTYLRAACDEYEKARQEKIDAITANQDQFTAEELAQFSDEWLDKFSTMTAKEPEPEPEPDYSGQGGPRTHSASKEEATVPAAPKPITNMEVK